MKKLPLYLLIIIALYSYNKGWGQNTVESEALFTKNLNEVYKNPEQSNKVANYIFTNATNNEQKAKALYLKSIASHLMGDKTESLSFLLKAKEQFSTRQDSFFYALLTLAVAEQYQKAGMTASAVMFVESAEAVMTSLPPEERAIISQKIEFLNTENVNAPVADTSADISQNGNKYAALNAINNNDKGLLYLGKNDLDSAENAYQINLTFLENNSLENSAIAAVALDGLGTVSFLKRDISTSKKYLLKALQQNALFPETAFAVKNKLATIYKMQDSLAVSQKYATENMAINSEILNAERTARGLLMSHLEKGQQDSIKKDMNSYYVYGGIIIIVLLIVLAWYYFYNKKLDKEYRKFEKIIKQIENKEKLEMAVSAKEATVTSTPKGIVIPIETENSIVERLKEFENSTDFTNPKMSLTLLAKQLKTNTKYLSEIIHNHKGKNFNTYINELRINYIIKLMQEDPQFLKYKVSYLAEKSGFTSHSSFTVVFKSITDITPRQFVNFLKKSNKAAS